MLAPVAHRPTRELAYGQQRLLEIALALATRPKPTAQLRPARLMLGTGGRVPIADVADEIGWSRRHFGERFRDEIGLAPKQAARILRFERAGALLRRGHLDLAGLAVECGYYDQAHLSNEWRTLAGCSPRTWIVEELPFLQDDSVFAGQD